MARRIRIGPGGGDFPIFQNPAGAGVAGGRGRAISSKKKAAQKSVVKAKKELSKAQKKLQEITPADKGISASRSDRAKALSRNRRKSFIQRAIMPKEEVQKLRQARLKGKKITVKRKK